MAWPRRREAAHRAVPRSQTAGQELGATRPLGRGARRRNRGSKWARVEVGQPYGQRYPLGVGDYVMLAPQLPAINGVRASRVAARGSLVQGAINQSPGPVDTVGPLQLGQPDFMQPLPDVATLPEVRGGATGL